MLFSCSVSCPRQETAHVAETGARGSGGHCLRAGRHHGRGSIGVSRRLRPEIETVFFMAGEAYSFISSRLVKQVITLGGSISGLVPPSVEARLRSRLT